LSAKDIRSTFQHVGQQTSYNVPTQLLQIMLSHQSRLSHHAAPPSNGPQGWFSTSIYWRLFSPKRL